MTSGNPGSSPAERLHREAGVTACPSGHSTVTTLSWLKVVTPVRHRGMDAIGYVRVSCAGQVDGEGLGVQREKIAGWCKYQGIDLVSLEEDAGLSGASTDRPAFKRAVRAALRKGGDAVLVVYKLDRLGRNAIDVQEVLAVLLDAGVRVVSLADGVDSASGMGATVLRIVCSVLALTADLERDTIRTRLIDGRRRADAGNRKYASEPRYGRTLAEDGRSLVVEPVEHALVERVRQLRAEGLSFRAICRVLLDEGHRPRRASSWSPTVVRRIATGMRAPKKTHASKRIERVRAELLAENDERPAA